MKTVVITGSTRGIGFGLAHNFLLKGCQVVISGRSPGTVAESVAALAKAHDLNRILGQPCDVCDYGQVQALWNAAAAHFGQVDIWINNAGMSNTLTPLWELDPQQIRTVVDTNVLGAMYGCSVAIKGMLKQGHGWVYNMEGFGSRGNRMVSGLTLYGTTKAALAFMDRSLVEELKGTPIQLGTVLPGMVVTDLLTNQRQGNPADWERTKKIMNILADRVETVTPWLVEQILKNDKHGARISWTNGPKIMLRFLTAPFHKRHIID